MVGPGLLLGSELAPELMIPAVAGFMRGAVRIRGSGKAAPKEKAVPAV